ncbi:CarD family transcriptional regulator [Thermopetrobacter sp. TC1]|uniref:CarD family transcriptional regulator n=1 Tax=Thermopetrobacter sp. TC1 TaxID=1495045 RepID=UPI00056E3204|nr:CarD family transcriptional regulator [Thermopetrobacter sp. TC1]
MAAKKKTSKAEKKDKDALSFQPGEFIVYPSHGVGKIVGIEKEEIAGMELELYVIDFEKEKMRLRVPTNKCKQVGMRKLSGSGVIEEAMKVLRGRPRIKRTMWSRRAQEYDAKINSGDIMHVAEVVRDLYRAENQPEQSYSERQLYEAALDRLAREVAAVKDITEKEAIAEIEKVLADAAAKHEAARKGKSSKAA